VGDVLFVVICLANQTGIELDKALQKNLEKKTARDFDRHQQNDKL
jgi:NTP pyrophosphatase (non-canonical NTP hydrolase)